MWLNIQRIMDHIKRKFSNIQIKEKKSSHNSYVEDEITNETSLLSENSLAEDWLSDEDNRWDEVLFLKSSANISITFS